MQTHITKPIYCVPFLQPGRLVKVEHNDEDFGWGAVVNFQKKANQKVCNLSFLLNGTCERYGIYSGTPLFRTPLGQF